MRTSGVVKKKLNATGVKISVPAPLNSWYFQLCGIDSLLSTATHHLNSENAMPISVRYLLLRNQAKSLAIGLVFLCSSCASEKLVSSDASAFSTGSLPTQSEPKLDASK